MQRIRDQRRRERRRADPMAYAAYCAKEPLRNEVRKEQGLQSKFKNFNDLTTRQKRSRRKQQKLWRTNYEQKHQNFQNEDEEIDSEHYDSEEADAVDIKDEEEKVTYEIQCLKNCMRSKQRSFANSMKDSKKKMKFCAKNFLDWKKSALSQSWVLQVYQASIIDQSFKSRKKFTKTSCEYCLLIYIMILINQI